MDKITAFISGIGISGKSIIGFGLNDIFDIIIISVLIYKIMLWVKETRAWSLLKGVLVILLINVSANFFNLYTVRWLIQNTFSLGLIALVVIFQPELRKALEQLGKGKYFSSFLTSDSQNSTINKRTLEELMRTIKTLANSKTGALIVVAQDNSLAEYSRTGIQIDGEISSQLLINIFVDKTPLHDGAVIIAKNKIVSASCILPLTESPLEQKYGTRHRAAVGMSEFTDAIIIVVSEETGFVSVAISGKLHKKQSNEDIKNLFSTDTVTEKKMFDSWRRG